MHVIVMGAGVIGVTTAYYLRKKGYKVTVIERNGESAAECSYANGGQLSYCHAEPWASPDILPKIPYWLLHKNSPLVFRPKADINMWLWGIKFLLCCTKKKAHYTTTNMVRLALHSRSCFKQIDNDEKIEYSKKSTGTLHIFKNEKALKHNITQAKFQKTLGCDFNLLSSREECEKIEPALKYSPAKIVGGIHFPMDETGNVNEFTVNLSKLLQQRGVEFKYNTDIKSIIKDGSKITGIETDKGTLTADKYVMAMGAYSPLMLKKIGINVPIYPLKGYSISIKADNNKYAPNISITDQANKIVYSRLGDIVRVAGTAELAGYSDKIKKKRIKTTKKMAKSLFPLCGDIANAEPWACLRPSTPDGAPIIGATKYENLYLNTGHGTLGWTLSCGSANIIANIVAGEKPLIDMTGLTIERF